MKKNPTQNAAGFSTIELLITFAVGIVFLTAAMMVAYSDPTLARQVSLESGQAAALDVALDSSALATSTTNIGYIIERLSKNWNATIANVSANGTNPYDVTPTITDIAPCFKEVTNVTGWNLGFGNRSHTMTFGTGLGNLSIAQALGRGGCDPTPPGEWDNPETTGLTISPSSYNGKGTGIDVALINGNTYGVISGDNPGANKKDLIVVNLSNSETLSEVSQTDLSDVGYTDVVVGKNYAYVVRNDSAIHIQIINLSNPTTPTVASQIILPQAPTAVVRSIAYYNNLLLVGTQYLACPGSCSASQNNEFHIYNVSNPAIPVHVGLLNINHNINDIMVKDNIAYLATSDNNAELMLVDISNPATLVHPDVSGKKFNAGGNFDGTSLYVLGNYAYLGREKATGLNFDLYKIKISNLTAEKWRRLNLTGGTGTEVTDIYVQGNLAFVINSDSTKTFQVWDIKNGPGSSIVAVSGCNNTIAGGDLPKSVALSYFQDRIFVVNENQATIDVLQDNPNACIP